MSSVSADRSSSPTPTNKLLTLPSVCLQSTTGVPLSNDCTASTLTYACVCSDGLSPNLTQYSQTLPFFICQEWGNQCQSNCAGDSLCVSDCRSKHPCGAQSPVRVNTSTASATPSATSGGGGGSDAVQTGFASNPSGGNQQGEANGAGSLSAAAAGWAMLGGAFVAGFAGLL